MMMRHMLGSLRQNLQNIKKSPKVADESMFTIGGNSNNNNNNNEVVNENEFPIYGNEIERRSTSGWKGFSIIYGFLMAPFSAFTCFSQPHVVNGSDGLVWASAEFSHMSEINHLMVSDSLRYAILM